jgi:hypothetical protein
LYDFQQTEFKKVNSNLWNLFAIPEAKSKDYFDKTRLSCLEGKEEFDSRVIALAMDEFVKFYTFSFHVRKEPGSLMVHASVPENTQKNDAFYRFVKSVFLSRLYSLLAFHPITSSVIFPVERNSIFTFSRELSLSRNDKLDKIQALSSNKEIDMLELFFSRGTRYPQPIRDGLMISDDLSNYQTRRSEFSGFADEIEAELLHGKVNVTKEGSVEFSSIKVPRTKLSFHQSASIVKTLASLVLYLRHQAQHNDLVIIDEPELNLHPDNQVLLARIFSRLVNKGLRLIVSTHSDYIVREFNNLIMVASPKPNVKAYAKEMGFKDDEFLKQVEVGAYMFDYRNQKSRQSEVRPIKVGDSGFEILTIDKTIDAQNSIAEELFYKLRYEENEK